MRLPRGIDLFQAGVEELVSILPPTAPFPAAGKAPGYWDGSQWKMTPGWQKLVATEEAVRQWGEAGANVGVLARFWPAFDVDTEEEYLRDLLVEIIHRLVGINGLHRDSRHPRKLLAFKAAIPGEITKHSLRFRKGDGPVQALEVLGDGNQWVASGIHPSGSQYLTERWCAVEKTALVTMNDVQNVLREAEEVVVALGYEIEHRGSATKTDRANVDQDGLKGRLEEVRDLIVNQITNDVDWDGWIQHGYAIKGALSEHPSEARDLWLQFTLSNPVGTVEEAEYQWSKMRPPFALGIDYLRGRAPNGQMLQALEAFTFLERPPEGEAGAAAPGVPGAVAGYVEGVRVRVAGPVDEVPGLLGAADEVRDIRREVYAYSDQELGRRLMNTPEGRNFKHSAGTWYVWDSTTWVPDVEEKWIASLVQDYLRGITIEVMNTDLPGREKDSIAKRIDGLAGSRAVVGLLASRRELDVHPDRFDPDDHLLNTPAGVIDLTTGSFRPHDKGLMCSMCTAVAPRKEFAFRWLQFIDELTEGDTELARYLQKLAGYALIGLNDLELLQMLIGAGGNGKSSYTETLVEVMGSYGSTLPQGTFTSNDKGHHGGDGATPSLARLRGKRLVVTSETNAGRWDEEKAKAWTGGERVTARALYSQPFTFKPKFTVIMTANTPPILTDAGPAWERRLRVIPCDFVPEVYEENFKAHLMGEGPEVLQWAIDGAVLYTQEGLGTPRAILEATSEYFEAQDVLGAWLLSACVRITGSEDDFTLTSDLLDSYNGWAVTKTESVLRSRFFGTGMKKKAQSLAGVEYTRRGPNGDRGYSGLRLIKGMGDLSA